MAVFIRVHVTDAPRTANGTLDTGQPQTATVTYTVDSGTDLLTMNQISPGLFESAQALPDSAAAFTVSVSVTGKPFFPFSQAMTIQQAPDQVTIGFGGSGRGINVRTARLSARNAPGGDPKDRNVELDIVMLAITDGQSTMETALGGAYGTVTANVWAFSTGASLNSDDGSSGLARFNMTPTNVDSGQGQLFIFQRKPDSSVKGAPGMGSGSDGPQVVVAYRVKSTIPTDPTATTPIHYHVFFHPSTETFGADPFNASYADLIRRYTLLPYSQGKAFAQAHVSAGKNLVFVMPVMRIGRLGDIANQTALLRLLDEINFYIQRAAGVNVPAQPAGNLALSGFSAGLPFMFTVFAAGGKNADATFWDRVREIYSFDGIFADSAGAQETANCIATLKRWQQKGSGRTIRIYTQTHSWDALNATFGVPHPTSRFPDNKPPPATTEAWSATGSLTVIPPNFWHTMDPAEFLATPDFVKQVNAKKAPKDWMSASSIEYWWVHQVISARLVQHAVINSGFV